MAKWIQTNSPGTGGRGIPGPPGPSGGTPAPNITSATVAVSFQLQNQGYSQQFVFSGVITLPTGDPDYSHLKRIDVVGIDPSGQLIPVVSFNSWVGSTISYTGVVGIQPAADQVWSVEYICYNEDGSPTVSPYTIPSVNVFAAAITTLTAAEISGARYQDVLQGLHTVVGVTLTMAHSQYPQWVTIWLNYADGRGDILQGDVKITAPGQTVRFGDPVSVQGQQQAGTIWVPPPGQSGWVAKAFPGAGSITPPGGSSSYSFTVTPVAQALSHDVTNAQFNPNPASGDPIVYTPTGNGQYLWDYYQLQFFQPTLTTDSNYWFTFLTVQKGHNYTGTCNILGFGTGATCVATGGITFTAAMVGEDIHIQGVLTTVGSYVSPTTVILTDPQPVGTGLTLGLFLQAPDQEGVDESQPFMLYRGRWVTDSGQYQGTVSIPGTYAYLNGPQLYGITPTDKNPDGTPYLYRTFRFRLYAASHANDNALGGSTGYVLQTIAWPANADGSKDYADVTPLTQPPALDLTKSAQFGLGAAIGGGNGFAIKVNMTGPMFTDISNNLNIAISNDFVVSSGSLTQHVVDLAKSIHFDTTNFAVAGGVLLVNAIAVNTLIAGNALFLGTTTFAYSGGGKITLNSGGMTIADSNTAPTATVTLASIGITITKGSNNVQLTSGGISIGGPSGTMTVTSGTNQVSVTATQVQLTDGAGSFLTLNAGTLTISHGSSSVTVTSSSVAIVNGAFSVSGSGFSVSINSAVGISVQAHSTIITSIGVTNGAFANEGLQIRNGTAGDYVAASDSLIYCYASAYSTYSVYISGGASPFMDMYYAPAFPNTYIQSRLFDANYNTPSIMLARPGIGRTGVHTGNFGGHPGLDVNGGTVVREQQPGPGNPSFTTLSDAQTWCSNLLTALRTHGLIT